MIGRPALLLLILALCQCLSACVTLAGYDQAAYEYATSLKAQTVAILRKSEDTPYEEKAEQLEDHLVRLQEAYEYANGIEYNNEAAANWSDLIESIYLPWVELWQAQGQTSPAAQQEFLLQLREAFDTIICLEANKRSLTACNKLTARE